MRRTLREMRARLDRLESSVEVIRAGPVEHFVAHIVQRLEEGPWGETLTELDALSRRDSPGDMKALDLFEQLQALATAFFNALGIRPYPARQRTLRLSTRRAQTYRWADDRPIPAVDRCAFEVLSPGWKRGDTLLLAPKICLADAPGRKTSTTRQPATSDGGGDREAAR